ncbi:hypothetical protein HWB76_gp041 [Streptomyces phage Blueeyedbeauty]|uniref:Uncharacterized protein n=1 Tax=Streptomyces phage Blueeyedbeauty TaxID=2250336 RepID=A0A345L257_9CAUD|nr:hypothetical protein HWB76_gp041 [Streptomyces phage Blueeyedbeauty]AXH49359.1 hypothetical protein SEA_BLUEEYEDBEAUTY_252 [Streptomyces phage Blueeyedbeauty]
MSRKTEAFRRDMMMGTITPHIPAQIPDWEPYVIAEKKVPCPRCGKSVKLNGKAVEQHYAATSNYICH